LTLHCTSGDRDRHFLGSSRAGLSSKFSRVVFTQKISSAPIICYTQTCICRCRPWIHDGEYISRIINLSFPPGFLCSVAAHCRIAGSILSQLLTSQSLVSKAHDWENIESQSTAVVAAVMIGELNPVAMKLKPPIAGRNYNGYLATRPAILGLAKVLFLGLWQVSYVSAAPVSQFLGITKEQEDLPKDAEDPSLWLYLGVAAVLVLLGGAFAGLTIA
jgi:hypothetical protein